MSTFPFHWNDRIKLENDFHQLNKMSDKIFSEVVPLLNEYHHENLPNVYWRILIFPWISYFVQTIFDRYTNLKVALDSGLIQSVDYIEYSDEDLVREDMEDWLYQVQRDGFNATLYSLVFDSLHFPSVRRKPLNIDFAHLRRPVSVSQKFYKRVLIFLYNFIMHPFLGNKLVYLSGLPFLKDLILKFRLRSIWLDRIKTPVERPQFDGLSRSQLSTKLQKESAGSVEKLLRFLVFRLLPFAFFENFTEMKNKYRSSNLGYGVENIISAGFLHHDTPMCFFAGDIFLSGRLNIFYMQHGGTYGTAKFHWAREYERRMASLYLIWGGVPERYDNSFKLGSPIYSVNPIRSRFPKGFRILVVPLLTSKYVYRLCSESARDLYEAYSKLVDFLSSARKTFPSAHLALRIPTDLYGFELAKCVSRRVANIEFDYGRKRFVNVSRDYSITVHTYNQTGFIESLSMNTPCLLVNDLDSYPIAQEVLSIYERLENLGVLHRDFDSALSMLSAHSSHIEEWWFCEPIQNVRNDFLDKVAPSNSYFVTDLIRLVDNFS